MWLKQKLLLQSSKDRYFPTLEFIRNIQKDGPSEDSSLSPLQDSYSSVWCLQCFEMLISGKVPNAANAASSKSMECVKTD